MHLLRPRTRAFVSALATGGLLPGAKRTIERRLNRAIRRQASAIIAEHLA